jgi:hypothetical protein
MTFADRDDPIEAAACRASRSSDLAQSAPTDADGADGEPTPIGVGQPDSSRPELPTEQPVFDDQVGDDFAFAMLEPTGEHQEQPLESRGVEHERQLTSRARHVDRMLGHYDGLPGFNKDHAAADIPKSWQGLRAWYCPAVSMTRMPAAFGLLLTIVWVLVLLYWQPYVRSLPR